MRLKVEKSGLEEIKNNEESEDENSLKENALEIISSLERDEVVRIIWFKN